VPLPLFKERFLEAVEDQLDVEAFDRAIAGAARDGAVRARAGAEATIPFDVVSAELEGTRPIAAWRKYRGKTQTQLAAEIGIDRGYLAQLEVGGRDGTADTLARIAKVLGCLIEDLLG
jgi:DNA-binding Xre family transcriptional regulator